MTAQDIAGWTGLALLFLGAILGAIDARKSHKPSKKPKFKRATRRADRAYKEWKKRN